MSFITVSQLRDLGLITLVIAVLDYFIGKPFRIYYNFRDELTRSGMMISGIFLNIGLPEERYLHAHNEINIWLGEINVIKNRLSWRWFKYLGIPSKEELDEAISCCAFIRNGMGRKDMIAEVFFKYQRLCEIFDINQKG